MNAIISLIYNNKNIPSEIKEKIIECCRLILINYPKCLNNLYRNLENIRIEYIDASNKYLLDYTNISSAYMPNINVMLLNKTMVNGLKYKNILLHELLHLSSHNNQKIGYINLIDKNGMSLTEGMTEYLTRKILASSDFGISLYNNDINNVILLGNIIKMENLIDIYFNGELKDLYEQYYNIKDNKNIVPIIEYMDKDYANRIKNGIFDNKEKDVYTKLLVNDLTHKQVKNNEEFCKIVSLLNSFIRSNYQTTEVPDSIKFDIEKSINNLYDNFITQNNKLK